MSYASDLGIKVGSKIKVTALGNNNACFCEGDIIEFVRDDGTLSPWFKKVGDISDHSPFSLRTHAWEHYKEEDKDMTKLQFPCCVATSEIKDEETFQKILDLFVANGATEEDKEFRHSEHWNWFGVDVTGVTTEYYYCVESYSMDCEEDDVTIYTVKELLAMLPEEEKAADSEGWIEWNGSSEAPVPYGIKLDVKYGDGIIATNIGNQDNSRGGGTSRTCTSWRHHLGGTGADIVAYRLHVPTTTPSIASQEAITERLEDSPSVGIDYSVMGTTASTEPLITITQEVKYTVSIKGITFTFTQEEIDELAEELLGVTTL